MKCILRALWLLPFLGLASPEVPTDSEFQTLMALGFVEFDQNLPAGGWRAITDQAEAGRVLDAYHLHNFEKLDPSQHRILYWHAGQAYATARLVSLATARFKKSYDPDEANEDSFKWNAYVRGTIAFLERDLKTLRAARDEIKAAKNKNAEPNLKILEAFIRCIKKSYREAYNPACK